MAIFIEGRRAFQRGGLSSIEPKLRFVENRYWNMRFCCAACMSDYQQRLSSETQAKILALDFCGPFWKAAS